MRILNIASVLPSPVKENENDIILTTALRHEREKEAQHSFALVIPSTGYVLSKLSRAWAAFYRLYRQGKYEWSNRTIYVLSALSVKSDRFRVFFYKVGYLFSRRRILKVAKACNPDIIHAHNALACAYFAKALSKELNVPYIITVRGVQDFYNNKAVVDNLNAAKAVISINHIQKGLINNVVKHPNHLTMPHGIDKAFFEHSAGDPRQRQGPVQLISICRLLKLKNLDTVFSALERTTTDFVYHIYGDGPDRERLESLLAASKIKDKVQFMGRIAHTAIPAVLAKYDIFVMPSYPETLGRVYFEAMAVGLPVIGAKGTGVDGYIMNGESGFLVTPGDIDELATVLGKLMSDPALIKETGLRVNKIAREFSAERMIEQLDGLYRSLIRS
jgi:teichuronic acid biosynthesis glycosyltransferase TuaC